MIHKRVRTLIFISIVLIFVAVVLTLVTQDVFYRVNYRIPWRGLNHSSLARSIRFEIATTTAAQERGLSGRASIPSDYAMLFVFNKDKMSGFWMKEMLVPIDIVWLSNSGRILGIDHSVQPSTYPSVFYPPQPVQYVLEMRADETERLKWKVGTTVLLPPPYGKNYLH